MLIHRCSCFSCLNKQFNPDYVIISEFSFHKTIELSIESTSVQMNGFFNVARNDRTRHRACVSYICSRLPKIQISAREVSIFSIIASHVFYRLDMSELRRRKGGPAKDRNRNSSHANGSSKSGRSPTGLPEDKRLFWFGYCNFLLGAIIALIVGVKYALYVRELHENDMWFSNIGVRLSSRSF